MSPKTYKARCLVLKKTKLGEKDLIVTLLDEQGRQLRGVAKGARKPGGSFAARLELFSEVDVMLAQGRSLDVVCDARLVGALVDRTRIEQSACCAPLAELLCTISQPDLPQPRVFDISKAAFDCMLGRDATPESSLAIVSASLWKVMSQAGFRPSFSRCALCGEPASASDEGGQVTLSVSDGGMVCANCPRPVDAVMVDMNTLRWCEALIVSRYSELLDSGIDVSSCFATLQVARMWARAHTGRDLKSLDFLLTSGLY